MEIREYFSDYANFILYISDYGNQRVRIIFKEEFNVFNKTNYNFLIYGEADIHTMDYNNTCPPQQLVSQYRKSFSEVYVTRYSYMRMRI